MTGMEKNMDEIEMIIRLCAACGKCSKSCPAHINISEAMKIYGEYLSGDVRILEKLNGMKSFGKPVDCIECGTCSCHCPNGIDVKERMRELAMMQSCSCLMEFPCGGRKETAG